MKHVPLLGFAFCCAIGACMATAPAQARPDTRQMSCAGAQNLVTRAGAIVLTTGAGTYERIVLDERFCLAAETIQPAFAATRDRSQCNVGYYCGQSSNLPFD